MPSLLPITPHMQLDAFISETMVVIQPRVEASSAPGAGRRGPEPVETLSIDLTKGSVQQLMSAPQHMGALPVHAVIGVCRLFKGYAVVVATTARVVATVLGADIFEVTGVKIITGTDARPSKENRALLALLRAGCDPEGAGRSMYFSYFYDVTLTAQRTAIVAQDPSPAMQTAAGRADKDFFWNLALVKPLIDAGAHKFVTPVMFGFIRQLPDLQFSGPAGSATGCLTLIARRGVQRAGTRHWRRGGDAEGSVANYVESEQLLQVDMPASTSNSEAAVPTIASYVQLRGSVPLLWSELPNLKYKPTRLIAPPEQQAAVFAKHINHLHEHYKDVVAINLVNQHGGEAKLEKMFRSQSEAYLASGGQELRYLAFDFHKELGAKNYHRMSVLWDQIAADFARHGLFLHTSRGVASKQLGVMRTNCIDCLDRTNVVQGMLARKSLEQVLQQLGLMPKGASLPDAYPDLEREFKILWADHGDAIALQYAGTGALKSGFTRTGKRTLGGLVDDGVKSVARYYLNNFQDGKKQDAVDLVTGAYVPEPGARPPFKRQFSPLVPVAFALLLLAMALRKATQMAPALLLQAQQQQGRGLLQEAQGSALVQEVMVTVVAPLIVSAVALLLVVKNGKYLVNRPQLCPGLAATVAKPKKKQ